MTLYEGMFLGMDIVDTCIIYKYISLLYGQRRSRRWVEIGSYAAFYLVSSVITFVNIIPLVNVLYSLTAYCLLGLNYQSSVKKRLLNTLVVALIMICIEGIAGAILGVFHLSMYRTIPYTDLQAKMICLILEVGTYIPLANLKYLKSDGMPLKHWFAILGVPVLSLVLIIEFSWNLEGTLAILGSLIIFFINIIVFYLYNDLLEMVFVKQEREVLGQQMEMYSRQYKQMENTIQNTRRLRHDMKNLLIQIEALADGQHQKELLELIGDMVISLEKQYEYSNSGNVVLDSILNYKLGYAKNKNMQTNLKIQVPSNMNLSAFDMTVLLGNLLDNAIEATELVETNPYIDVEILYEFGMLYIKVKNSYAVELPGEETTLKRDKQNHGIGLQSVKSIVDKYQGNIKISKERDIYQTEIWLPNC